MSIEDRLSDLLEGDIEIKQAKIKKSINQFYLNYGHSSIADCANVPVFVEGVSMLAAKALQDHPLYNGQERSTRYQDFSTVPFYAESEFSKQTVEVWRSLYKAYLPKIEEWVRQEYATQREDILAKPEIVDRTPEEHAAYLVTRNKSWDRTCKAIAFDVARGLLPCGATTSLSMYMSLRKYRDHLTELATHPLKEVREIAVQINDSLYARYPNTFKPIRVSTTGEPARNFYLTRSLSRSDSYADVVNVVDLTNEGKQQYLGHDNLWFGIAGGLDFGSYRDLQRHRNGKNQMPLVSAVAGRINHFYEKILREVDEQLYQQVLDTFDSLIAHSDLQNPAVIELQYAHPMMTQVPTGVFWSSTQLKYVLELRSKTSVHPTLRAWCDDLYFKLPVHIAEQIDFDSDPDYWQSDRGEQDLKRKSETGPKSGD